MQSPRIQVRRANLDDLPGLRKLWKRADVFEPSIEKRFTEFQIVEITGGAMIACAALEISDRQGKIHCWILPDAEIHEEAEQLLWKRMRTLAENHGLVRFWTLEIGDFWRLQAFSEPDSATRRGLPSTFGLPSQNWRFLQLRDDSTEKPSLEQHLELFQETQRRLTEKTLGRIRVIRWLAAAAAIAILFAVIWLAWRMLNHLAIPISAGKP